MARIPSKNSLISPIVLNNDNLRVSTKVVARSDTAALLKVRRHLDRKTPWRLVKKYCRAAGIDPMRMGGRGIGIHSLRKTAINDAIRNGATMHEVREFAGHADIRTTEVYFVRKEEDAEVVARRIHIRVTRRKGE